MAGIMKRIPVLAVGSVSVFLFLVILRLINEVSFLKLLSCFGQTNAQCAPAPVTWHHRSLTYHDGYINIKTHEPLQLDCGLCAIVSNSGQMIGRRAGRHIDRSSCVWRMNNAPTKGYTEDVGSRTSIRVVSHTSVPLLLKDPDYFFRESNRTIYVIWGPFRNMRQDGKGIVYNMLRRTVENYNSANVYITTETRMNYCDSVFKKETGRDRAVQNIAH
ncbi:alpha-N-acetylgalactosaminide alpha-2,6-sialyltransferase 3 isoform X4 [Engystomops pustulosus]|uniref:alpha-N-acetylgalactosaminide alpha-2,6-sialyltransferase 3 isoform X4 n=1 Tax=Engystomops pustulosus TaxID=76066 RepID=UPI003AFA1E0B